MPYPSTPSDGLPRYSILSPSIHIPSHRTRSPAASALRLRSPLLSPLHHVISISGEPTDSPTQGGYFSAVYDGATRTPLCSPAADGTESFQRSLADLGVSFGLAIGVGLGIAKAPEGKRNPGLRISEMPPAMMLAPPPGLGERSTSSTSDDSATSCETVTSRLQDAGVTPGGRSVHYGLGIGWSEDERERGLTRTATPFPSERDEWIADDE